MTTAIEKMVENALKILSELGVPTEGLPPRRKEKMAKAFLAVAGMTPKMKWSQAKDNDDQHQLLSRQVISFMNEHWGENISSGSYDDIRRKDLILPVEALIVLNSAKNPDANTNDGTRGFAINPLASKAIRKFGTPSWKAAVAEFHKGRPTLADQMTRARSMARIPVKINGNVELQFSAGGHNALQKAVIESFLPIFGYGAQVLYVGDTAKKNLFLDEQGLKAINFFELAHEKLPDVVAYSSARNWLYLVEAVTTANPITELRRIALIKASKGCKADLIFVTAFPDRATYRKFAKDIAWETEVWLADSPEHMIHFNGDKFMGPYKV
jgi:hypothetical protein